MCFAPSHVLRGVTAGSATCPGPPTGLSTTRRSLCGRRSQGLPHAEPSHSPWGAAEPLVTFLTFFIFSITPDVVTLNREKQRKISVVQ